jgi:CTP:molybdopterin cytidylyltransferase MocA
MNDSAVSIAAIIPAAGFGARAGGPKLFLTLGKETFLSKIYNVLKSTAVKSITVVVQQEHSEKAGIECPDARVLVNLSPELGMFSSLLIGAKNISDVQGLLIAPVDHPYIKSKTVHLLIEEFQKYPDCVVVPQYKGHSGHPIIIPRPVLRNEQTDDVEQGLDARIKQSKFKRRFVDVDDEGILKNINLKYDYISS